MSDTPDDRYASASPVPGPHLALPPPDRDRSRYTGWTRQHWLAVADHLLEVLPAWATADGAQFRLPGRTSVAGAVSDGVEGFARPFLIAAYRMTTADAARRDELVERYADGLIAATDPRGPYAWPALTDRSQQIVEAAAVAVALHVSRQWLWDRLDPAQQDQIAQWFAPAVGIETHPNNWLLFRTVIQQFLASVGHDHDTAEIEYGLDRADGWYLGDGWYTDGDGRKLDYYNAWAMHYYPLIWSTMTDDDGGRGAVYRERLRAFLETFSLFVGRGGAPVFQGRSLTYRYGMLAPFWLGVQFDASPLTPGQTRRLCSGVLRHFTERGVPDRSGLLSLGWYEPFLGLTQNYSGPGSPYWAAKGFAGLALPPDHEVWTAPEEALPQDDTDVVANVDSGNWLLHHTHDDGVVRLVNHGSDHNDPPPSAPHEDALYNGFAYSNVTSPDLDPTRASEANHVWFTDGGWSSRRRRVEPAGHGPGWAASRYRDTTPAGAPVAVDVVSLVWNRYELRVAAVECDRAGAVRLAGYALGADPAIDETVGPGSARVTGPGGLVSAVVGLYGMDAADVVRSVATSAFGGLTALPRVAGPHSDGRSVHVALVGLGGEPVPVAAVQETTVAVELGDTPASVAIALPDGRRFDVILGGGTDARVDEWTPGTTA